MRTWNAQLTATWASGSSIAGVNVSLPGRMMIKVPTKPPHTRAQRRGETCSFKNDPATSVRASGEIIMMAVNSPTGMNFRLRNTSMLLVISISPRRT